MILSHIQRTMLHTFITHRSGYNIKSQVQVYQAQLPGLLIYCVMPKSDTTVTIIYMKILLDSHWLRAEEKV